MSNYTIEFDIQGKVIEIENKFYRFEYGGKLIITNGDESAIGRYDIIKKGKRFYLVTEPKILEEKELTIDLLLGGKIVLVNSEEY